MQQITVQVGPLAAADDNGICESQQPLAAGDLTIDGALASDGVAVLDAARRVLITATGDESSNTFTITGTSYNGRPQSEVVTGPNATTAQSVLDYKTVTSVSISGAAADAIIVGTSGVASSRWVRLDSWAFSQVGLQVDVSGTVDYSVQQTFDDPNDLVAPVPLADVVWLDSGDAGVVTEGTSKQSSYAYAPTFVKVTINSGNGSATMRITQYGNVPV